MESRRHPTGQPSLVALARAIEVEGLPEGRILFLRAALSSNLADLAPRADCIAWLKDDADRLAAAGWRLVDDPVGEYAASIVLAGRDRDETRGLLAVAIDHTRPGGPVLVAAANLDGAASVGRDLEAAAGTPTSFSKHKSRVFRRIVEAGAINRQRLAEWTKLSHAVEVRPGYLAQPGLFGWDRMDRGSALLAGHLPEGLVGTAVDLGTGTGFLALELLRRNPRLQEIHLIDLDRRALACAAGNLAPAAGSTRVITHWADATRGIRPGDLAGVADLVVSNPPFHRTRAAEPGIGQAFIAAAHAFLKPGGRFLLVANRSLPYETVLDRLFRTRRTLKEAEGYKILEAVR